MSFASKLASPSLPVAPVYWPLAVRGLRDQSIDTVFDHPKGILSAILFLLIKQWHSSSSLMFSWKCGSHTNITYSKGGQTSAMYAALLQLIGHCIRFQRMKPWILKAACKANQSWKASVTLEKWYFMATNILCLTRLVTHYSKKCELLCEATNNL